MVRSSVARAISSEPESPSTVKVVTMLAVLVLVTRPLRQLSAQELLWQNQLPADTPESARSRVTVEPTEPELKRLFTEPASATVATWLPVVSLPRATGFAPIVAEMVMSPVPSKEAEP